MALVKIALNTPPTSSANNQKVGKGNWRIAGGNSELIYSTDGINWYQLSEENSPVTLYNCTLYVDTSSDGFVERCPKDIIPRYSRFAEHMSKDEELPEVEKPTTADVYEDM